MNFQQKDCDIHNKQPFFVFKMRIPKKWQIPLTNKDIIYSNIYIFKWYYVYRCLHIHTKILPGSKLMRIFQSLIVVANVMLNEP